MSVLHLVFSCISIGLCLVVVRAADHPEETIISVDVDENCIWDTTKPFEENLKCMSKRRDRRDTDPYADYNHPCTAYVRLHQPERRVGNRVNQLTGSALCDRTLKRRWYRFAGPAGGSMPEECVDEFDCGTHAPIWLNGRHPDFYGEVLDLEACVSLGGRCCSRKWYIRVANCGDFYSYLLTDTPGCFMAYCAGRQKPCPEGESSATGFTPGCSDNFPKLTGSANLHQGKEGHQVAFYCDYTGPINRGASIDVEWFVEGDNSGRGDEAKFPVFTDSLRDRRRSVLKEGHWMGKMGSTIYCQMRARWSNRTGVPSPVIKSDEFFAGIKILKRMVEVGEDGDEAVIQIQSTMPITCLPQFDDVCKVTVELAHDSDVGSKMCVDGDMRQVVFGDCSIDITPDNWRDTHNVSVKAVRDFYNDGNKNMRVNFKPIYSTLSSPLWNNYELPEVEVVARDAPTKMCSSTGDPHYSTFDGLYYHVFLEGEFVLYKNTRFPLQINTRLEQCGKTVSCNCGVAVKAADDVIVIDRCQKRKRNLAYGSSFPEGWRTLHRHALEQGESFVDGLKIYEYEEGRRYTVHLPTGAYVDFRVGEHWVNIYLYASSDDWMSTLGLCGTFDGDKANDFTFPDGLTQTTPTDHAACGEQEDVCKFAKSWRVAKEASFFGAIVEVPVEEHSFIKDSQYCKCQMKGGKPDIVCNYHYDVHNCQSEAQKRKGKDKTDDIKVKMEFPDIEDDFSRSQGRRVRRSVDGSETPSEIDMDYFDAEFVYDEDFVGMVPEWPTPSGIVEAQARAYCIDVVMLSAVSSVCNKIVNEKLSHIIDECMIDIKVTDDLDWALSSLTTLTSECLNEIHQTAEYWEKPPADDEDFYETYNDDSDPDYDATGVTMVDSVCPSVCSRRGDCRLGRCHCYYGFTGDDCSAKMLLEPEIQHVTGNGLCDAHSVPCETINIHGTGFHNSTELFCHYKLEDGDTVTNPARFLTFEEIMCPLPHHTINPKGVDPEHGTQGTSRVGYLMSLIQNGVQSNDVRVVVYDARCQECTIYGSLYQCSEKNNSCVINGFCLAPGDRHPFDCCRICDPLRAKDRLMHIIGNEPPTLLPMQTSYMTTLGDIWETAIRATDPTGCAIIYDAIRDGRAPFELTVTSGGVHVRLEPTDVGTYSFRVTAEEECGAKASQSYNVFVMPRQTDVVVKEAQSTECIAAKNLPPKIQQPRTNFTVLHDELLKIQIRAKDPDGDALEYYVLKENADYASVTRTGLFRYVGPTSAVRETVTLVVMDVCKAKAYIQLNLTSMTCPCQNGGKCNPNPRWPRGSGRYWCRCPPSFTGRTCAVRRVSQPYYRGRFISN